MITRDSVAQFTRPVISLSVLQLALVFSFAVDGLCERKHEHVGSGGEKRKEKMQGGGGHRRERRTAIYQTLLLAEHGNGTSSLKDSKTNENAICYSDIELGILTLYLNLTHLCCGTQRLFTPNPRLRAPKTAVQTRIEP